MKKNLIFLIFLFCACGYYSFSGSTLPSHLKTIAIPIFDDRSAEFGIREAFNDALVQKYTTDNTLKIADSRTADSILEGTILTIRDQAGAYSSDETVQDIKISITIEIAFRDVKKQEIIWEGRLTQWGTYDPDDVANGREAGLQEAIDKLVEDIFNNTISGW